MIGFVLFFVAIAFQSAAVLGDAAQVETYVANHGHGSIGAAQNVSVTAFFSPDHSAEQFTRLVQSATHSIDISTPGAPVDALAFVLSSNGEQSGIRGRAARRTAATQRFCAQTSSFRSFKRC